MIQHVIYLYRFNLGVAARLVQDLTPQQMVQQPAGVVNHPAWSLGHLAMTANNLAVLLGLESQAPKGWPRIFATGGIPSGDPSLYPSKEELLAFLTEQHERNSAAVLQADPAWFATPHPNEQRRKFFPTVGDMVVMLMTSHEMNHLGQISAWRRATSTPFPTTLAGKREFPKGCTSAFREVGRQIPRTAPPGQHPLEAIIP